MPYDAYLAAVRLAQRRRGLQVPPVGRPTNNARDQFLQLAGAFDLGPLAPRLAVPAHRRALHRVQLPRAAHGHLLPRVADDELRSFSDYTQEYKDASVLGARYEQPLSEKMRLNARGQLHDLRRPAPSTSSRRPPGYTARRESVVVHDETSARRPPASDGSFRFGGSVDVLYTGDVQTSSWAPRAPGEHPPAAGRRRRPGHDGRSPHVWAANRLILAAFANDRVRLGSGAGRGRRARRPTTRRSYHRTTEPIAGAQSAHRDRSPTTATAWCRWPRPRSSTTLRPPVPQVELRPGLPSARPHRGRAQQRLPVADAQGRPEPRRPSGASPSRTRSAPSSPRAAAACATWPCAPATSTAASTTSSPT